MANNWIWYILLIIMSGASLIAPEKLHLLDIQDFEIAEARNISTARQLKRVIPVCNHAEEKEFALYDYGDDGFILMHRETGTILEQVKGRAPFSNSLDTKKYYLGIGNYFEEKGNSLTKYGSGEVVDKAKFSEYEKHVIEFTAKVKECSEVKSLTTRKKIAASTAPIAPDAIDLENVTHNNIGNSEKLAAMNDAKDYGNNVAGSCVAVSHNILLQFYAKTRDDAIMPTEIPQKWINACAGHKVQDYDASIKSTDSIGEAAHKYLICLSGTKKFGITQTNITKAMESYLRELACVDLKYYSKLCAKSESAIFEAKNWIDSSMPATIVVNSRDKSTHSIVAYGYVEGNWSYFRVHYGWNNEATMSYSDYYINQNLVTDFSNVGYLGSFKSNHNFQTTDTSHTCLNMNCYSVGRSHSYEQKDDEFHTCEFCEYDCAHDFYCTPNGHICSTCEELVESTYNKYNGFFHSCNLCGVYWSHEWLTINDRQICTKCAEIKEHDLTHYTYIDDIWHKKACADSGCYYSVEERHNKIAERVEGNAFVHNERCQNCSYHKETVSHTITTLPKDSSYHHRACICGYVKILSNTPVAHTFKWDSKIFKYRCAGCGYIK